MGKKGGGGNESQVVTQKADPWIGVQPYLTDLYSNAAGVYRNGAAGYYPGQLSATPNWDVQRGMALTRDTANGVSPTLQHAQAAANFLSTGGDYAANPFTSGLAMANDPNANGTFLDKGNPYLRGMVDAASRPIVENFQNAVAPSMASQFSAAGRMGSGAHLAAAQNAQSTLGRQLSDTSSQLYGGAYEAERGRMANAYAQEQALRAQAIDSLRNRQLQAVGLAPALEQARYLGADRQLQMGLLGQQMQQDSIDREVGRYKYNAEQPMQRLMQYNSILSGAAPYASSSGTQDNSRSLPYNRLTGTIGGGMGGYALGSLFGMGPVGAAVGALGGLFG